KWWPGIFPSQLERLYYNIAPPASGALGGRKGLVRLTRKAKKGRAIAADQADPFVEVVDDDQHFSTEQRLHDVALPRGRLRTRVRVRHLLGRIFHDGIDDLLIQRRDILRPDVPGDVLWVQWRTTPS